MSTLGKTWEAAFIFSAKQGSGFASTINRTKSQISEIQKEIVNLNKTQADISAYEKQQGKIEATNQKLASLKAQYENLNQEKKKSEEYSAQLQKQIESETGDQERLNAMLREAQKYETELNDKMLSRQRQIDTTNNSLQSQTDKLKTMETALKEAGVDTGNLTQESARLDAEIGQLRQQEQDAAKSAEDMGRSTADALDAASTALVSAGIAEGLRAIYAEFEACVNIAKDFEATMSTVEALSGAGADDLERLSQMAKDLGATTKYTATESAEAMTYMAMAGWDAEQMLSGMDGVLQLAAASGEDLAQVSDIVTDNLTAFGLKASDTAHFADVLAAAATNSNTSVAIMGETFKNSASIAGALGYSVDDVAVAIGLMANAGIKGSNAGTALKNTFNGLLQGVTLTGAAIGEYELSAINVDGTMKSWASTVNELRDVFGQMTEAEKVNNAMTIAGSRTYNGLLSIINATDDDFQSLTDSIQSCTGAAQEMAQIKMDNLQGQITLYESAMDALKTSIGEEFQGDLRKLYAIGTDVLGVANEFVQDNPALLRAVTAFVGVVGTATAGLTAYAAVSKVIKALDMASMFTSPIMAGVLAAGALVGIFAALASAADEADDEFADLTLTSQQQYSELQKLNSEYDRLVQKGQENSYEAEELKIRIGDLTNEYEAHKQTVSGLEERLNSLNEAHLASLSAYEETKAGIEGETEGSMALIDKLEELAAKSSLTADEQYVLNGIVDELNSRYGDLGLTLDETTGKLNMTAEAIRAAAEKAAETRKKQADYEAYVQLLQDIGEQENLLAEIEANAAIAREQYNAAQQAYDEADAARTTSGWLTQLIDLHENEGRTLSEAEAALESYSAEQESAQAVLDEMAGKQSELEERLGLTADALAEEEAAASAAAAAQQQLADKTVVTRQAVDDLIDSYAESYAEAQESLRGQYALWDKVAAVAETSVGDMNAALESQITHWYDYNNNLTKLAARTDIVGLDQMLASFTDGSDESIAAVAALASATDSEVESMVQNWMLLQRAQDATAESLTNITGQFPEQLAQLQEEYNAYLDSLDLDETTKQRAKDSFQEVVDGGLAVFSEASLYAADNAGELTGALDEEAEAIEAVADKTHQLQEAEARQAADAETLEAVIEDVTTRAQALAKAYQEVYDAAYNSITGQYALWDEAADVSATSAETIGGNVQSQVEYWQNYNANLASLADRANEIEGLSDVIASFADGSADSVNAIAGLASASDEDLAQMVEDWKALQAVQQETADAIAQFHEDFAGEMEDLTQEVADSIEDLDLSDEARRNAEKTLQESSV